MHHRLAGLSIGVVAAMAILSVGLTTPPDAPARARPQQNWCEGELEFGTVAQAAYTVYLPWARTSRPRPQPAAPMVVSFIDVGDGDAILIQQPDVCFEVLIDGGDVARYGQPARGPTVEAYLASRGVDKLELMIATHSDSDHIGGLVHLLEEGALRVDRVWYNGAQGNTNTWRRFATAVPRAGLQLTPAPAGYCEAWARATACVLNPQPDAGSVTPGDNDRSIVIHLTHGDVTVLLTGDIERDAELVLLQRGVVTPAGVLKVAHHGSTSSSSEQFLTAVRPTLAVVSGGPDRPNATVGTRLAEMGIAVLTTGQGGTIVLSSDGLRYAIVTSIAKPTTTQTPTPAATATETPTPTPTEGPEVEPRLSIEVLRCTDDDEWIRIRNDGAQPVPMQGWRIHSAIGGQTFCFPATVVRPAQYVDVHSGPGALHTPPAQTYLLWQRAPVWNDDGDTARLLDPRGTPRATRQCENSPHPLTPTSPPRACPSAATRLRSGDLMPARPSDALAPGSTP
jgi:beta-lactamase superfamily II metal-dependent hydrolase